jgi:hypothetical protein
MTNPASSTCRWCAQTVCTCYVDPAEPAAVVRTPTVVHCMASKAGACNYDVYVGRGRDPHRPSLISPWGNPFSHKAQSRAAFKVDSVEEAVSFHRRWVLEQPLLVARIKRELKNKTLSCWCITKANPHAPCHAWTLLEIANSK